jgi:hypothetical protein
MVADREMIADIHNTNGVSGGIELDEWEEDFIDSLEDRLNSGRSLTPKQREILVAIWDRI